MVNTREKSMPVLVEAKRYILSEAQKAALHAWVVDGKTITESVEKVANRNRRCWYQWWSQLGFRKAAAKYIEQLEELAAAAQFRNRIRRKEVVFDLMDDDEDPDVRLTAVRRSQQEEPERQEHAIITTNPFNVQAVTTDAESWTDVLPPPPDED